MIEINSHLEYFKIHLTNEGDDDYLIEINKSDKINKYFKSFNITVFDCWHDDEIYTVDCNNDYVWIRIKSKFGIGSISFLPIGYDEKNKDYAIIHKYVYEDKFEPVIGVFVHPNTEDRILKTKEHILSLKNSGIPIYLCSNIGCPDELVSLCDGYIYTGPNELCTVPNDINNKREYLTKTIKRPVVIYPEMTQFYQLHSFVNGEGTYLYAAAKCLKESINTLGNLGFTHIMISEGEFVLDDLDFEKPKDILYDMYKNNIVLDFFYTKDSNYLQAYLWFGKISHINNAFKDISKHEKHYPRSEENSNSNAFVLCEKYYMNKLFSYDPTKKIKIRTVFDNITAIKKKYWYTQRTDVVLYDEKIFYKNDEKLSFYIYFPNTKKTFLSIATENVKSNKLTKTSFDLDIYKNNQEWIFIIKNNTNSKKIICEYIFYNNDTVVSKNITPSVTPNFYFFSKFNNIDVNITKCDYRVYLEDNFEYYYDTLTLN